MPIRLTVRVEFCEVVIERRMDYGIGSGRSALQALKIIQRAAMDLGSCRGNRSGSRIRASEASTLCPATSSSWTIAEPMNPVAPVTKTRMEKSSVFGWRTMSVGGLSW